MEFFRSEEMQLMQVRRRVQAQIFRVALAASRC